MDGHYYDQSWGRRQNRFDAMGNDVNIWNVGCMRRGNSAHCINRPFRPDYSFNPHSQFENMPDYRESYIPQTFYDSTRHSYACDNRSVGRNSCTHNSQYNTPYNVNDYSNNICARPSSAARSVYNTPDRSTSLIHNNCRDQYRHPQSNVHCNGCTYHSHGRGSERETISPSRAFKDDVIKVVKPIIEDLQSQYSTPQRESNVFEVNKSDASRQPKGATAEEVQALLNKIKKLEQSQIDISAKYDSLASKLDQTNKAVSQVDLNCDKKIRQAKIPASDKNDLGSNPLLDSIVAALETKITEMDSQIAKLEQNQIKTYKDLDKKIKDVIDNFGKSKGSTDNENILKEIVDIKKYISKLESSFDVKLSKVSSTSTGTKTDSEDIRTLKMKVDMFDKQMKDAIKTESDYILKRVKDAIDIAKNESDKRHEVESNEISKIKTLFNLQASKNKESSSMTTDSSVRVSMPEEVKTKPVEQKPKMPEQMKNAPEPKKNAPEPKKNTPEPKKNAPESKGNAPDPRSTKTEKPVSSIPPKTQANAPTSKPKDSNDQNVIKPASNRLQDMSSNVLQRVGKAITENVGTSQKVESSLSGTAGVGLTAADIRKYKNRAIKQIEEIEMQTLQTMGMLQFNSDSPSPFEDDIVSEARFKEWTDRVKLARTLEDIRKIGKEIEEETKEEFINIVFSKDALQDEDIDLDNEYKAYNISYEEAVPDSEDDEINNYCDDFDDE